MNNELQCKQRENLRATVATEMRVISESMKKIKQEQIKNEKQKKKEIERELIKK